MSTLLEKATPRPWTTPRPWKWESETGLISNTTAIFDAEAWSVAPLVADAELIVRAVNAYDPLVKALDEQRPSAGSRACRPCHRRVT